MLDVPKTPILVFGKSLSPFSGGATLQNAPFGAKTDPKMKNIYADVPKTPMFVFGKLLLPFFGGATKYIKNEHYNPVHIYDTYYAHKNFTQCSSAKFAEMLSFVIILLSSRGF